MLFLQFNISDVQSTAFDDLYDFKKAIIDTVQEYAEVKEASFDITSELGMVYQYCAEVKSEITAEDINNIKNNIEMFVPILAIGIK